MLWKFGLNTLENSWKMVITDGYGFMFNEYNH